MAMAVALAGCSLGATSVLKSRSTVFGSGVQGLKPISFCVRKNEAAERRLPSICAQAEETELESNVATSGVQRREGLEERFAVLYSGVHECSSCGYNYNQALGDKAYPIAPGMAFKDLPDDWLCPTCGAAKSYFNSKSVEVAGFAQNQSYGLGGNSLTSGQKSLLIYGSLGFFFALFLSGYFLQ